VWEFLLPLLISTFSGALGSGISASTTEAANERTALGQQAQRRSLQSVVDELRNPNYGNVDAQFMLDLGRTLGQMHAQDAQHGTTGSGRSDTAARDAVTKGLAQLGQFKAQDQTSREQQIAQILSNPAFAGADPNSFHPGSAFWTGLLGGAAGGAGNALSAFLSTTGGTEILKNALKGSPPVRNPEQTYGGPTGFPSEGAVLSPTMRYGDYFSAPTFQNPAFGG